MQRRTFMKSVAGTAVAGGALAAGGAATQQADGRVTMNGQVQPQATGRSPFGLVEAVVLSASGTVAWQNLANPAESVEVRMRVAGPDGDRHEIASASYDAPSETTGTLGFGDDGPSGDVIANSPYEASDFEATETGETAETTLTVFLGTSIVHGNSEMRGGTEHEATVTVENTGSPSGGFNSSQVDVSVEMAEPDAS